MTEETTPELNSQEDNSAFEENNTDTTVDTQETTAPEAETAEPKTDVDEAETEGKEKEPELILGKFKTVEDLQKAYKESEKFVTKAQELEKKLQAYQQAEEQAKEQREIAARRQGYNDQAEQELDYDIRNHEFHRYVQAMETTLSGDAYKNAYDALLRYQRSGSPKDLMAVKSCFSPAVISEISKDAALFESQKRGEYDNNRQRQHFDQVKGNLEKFAKETNGWLDAKERQDIVGMAVNITGGDCDLNQVKGLIDALEKSAVDRYIASQNAAKENEQVRNSLQTPTGSQNAPKGEHWFTKDEYNAMTPEQERKYAKKISEQVILENEGKLPKMLTR